MIYTDSPSPLPAGRAEINRAYLTDEDEHLNTLLTALHLDSDQQHRAEEIARRLVEQLRREKSSKGGIGALLQEYDLSSQEGVMLMCLAEALLRIPDAETADRLIRDKLSQAEWDSHLGKSASFFVNASTWGLLLTGHIVQLGPEMVHDSSSFFSRLVSRSGEPMIRMAIKRAMKIIGQQFVMGTSIEGAIRRSQESDNKLFRYSFDMLGEAALTAKDADKYFDSYLNAIRTLGAHAQPGEEALFANPGISVKLSALHPRYEYAQRTRVLAEMPPRLLELARAAKQANINMTVDAEEADRLDLSLEIFEQVLLDESLTGWDGFGLAVQAYQKRAVFVIDHLNELSWRSGHRIPIRLVKGAYWDTEIKRAQEQGLPDYPLFTRKSSTDTAFLACAQRLLNCGSAFYPQFATHNAHTLASIVVMAGNREYEFQRLHGMGDGLYEMALTEELTKHCRVYAPVGSHEELLPYLVRRLLENGANTSFVNQIVDEHTPVEQIIANPIHETEALQHKRHPRIPLPREIYAPQRVNSAGINLSDPDALAELDQGLEQALLKSWIAAPIVGGKTLEGEHRTVTSPANREHTIGEVQLAHAEAVEQALSVAHANAVDWSHTPADKRADILNQVADMLERNRYELMALAIREGGRTIHDALSEVREAIDFCRYYAARARQDFANPVELPGVTGERNELRLHGRGVFVCISPWNFPVAIFTGQIAAALAAGNSVIAKPAGPTSLTGAKIVNFMHQAGVPAEVLHFLPGGGSEIGMALVRDPRTAGIAFTGSTDTARQINQALAQRDIIIPFIAETGGQNAMIVDSSALPEQVVADTLFSAFDSAGQRCSALRVLFVQADVAPRITELLSGAMEELVIGDPALLNTDIGPVINDNAKAGLQQHVDRMHEEAELVKTLRLPESCNNGTFFAPHAFEIKSLDQLTHEVFGPVLHIIRYEANQLHKVVEAINNTRYGLTLGIHSRIDSTAQYIARHARCGNTYVNRNMIGAVVGTQPFGGEGLSGTGPKAGGPHYLHRFASERVLTINTTAVGGNASLLSIREDDET